MSTREQVIEQGTPVFAYPLAIGAGIAIPFISLRLAFTLASYSDPQGRALAVILFLGLIPVLHALTSYLLVRKWPATSALVWVICIIAPFVIMLWIQRNLPGLLFVLPAFIGAKLGQRYNAKQERS